MKLFVTLILALGLAHTHAFGGHSDHTVSLPDQLTPEALGPILQTSGLEGWIHGAAHEQGLYVFTVRHPRSFFLNVQFPIIPTPMVAQLFSGLHRHDRVRVKGFFIENDAPIGHIMALEVEVLEYWQPSESQRDPYQYQTRIPEDLLETDHLQAVVHAVEGEGRVLVIEYGDVILPVFVEDTSWTKDLFRNDLIELHYVVRSRPQRPSHLELASDVSEPVVVLESVVELHNQPITLTGRLTMFEESPQVIFNVFAVEKFDENGLRRFFTLVNFEDPEVFFAIRDKLQAAWDVSENIAVNGRNKRISTNLYVTATGLGNVVAANQANPQIILAGPDAVNVEIVHEYSE